jgi:hypothetical protein
VRTANGDRLEGIMVQFIAPNAVSTTVTTDQDGHYEFPRLVPGSQRQVQARPVDARERDGAEGHSGA